MLVPFLLLSCFVCGTTSQCTHSADIVIWGGTVCGLTASITANQVDPSLSVLWLVNGSRLGGMTSGGLGGRDGGKGILGGIAADLWGPLGENFEPSAAESRIEALLLSHTNNTVTLRTTGWLLTVTTENGTGSAKITSATTPRE